MSTEDAAFFQQQADDLAEAARLATNYANANPNDAEAQAVANLAGDGLASARRAVKRLSDK